MEPTVTIINKRTGEMKQIPLSQRSQYISTPMASTQPQTQPISQSQPQQNNSLLKTLAPLIGSIIGGVAGIPFGPAGVIGLGAAGGAGGSALAGGSGGDILKEGAMGAVGGLFPAFKIGKAAKALGVGAKVAGEVGAQGAERAVGQTGKLAGLGQALKRGATIAPKSSLDTFSQQQLLQRTVDRYPQLAKASGTGKFQKVDTVIDDLVSEVDKKLAGIKTSVPGIKISTMAGNIAQSMDPNDQRNFIRVFNRTVRDTFGEKIPDNLTPLQINQLRRGFNKQASAAYRSITKGGVLSAPNQAIVELRDLTDDLLTESLPKNIKSEVTALNKDMSVLIKGIPEFQALSEQTMRLPGPINIPIPGGERVKQKLLAQSGRAIGGVAGKIPPYTTENILGQVGSRTLGGGLAPTEVQAAGLPSESPGVPINTAKPKLDITEFLKMAALADLGSGGKHISEIIALSNFLNPAQSASTKTQMQQIAGAQGLVNQLEGVYTQASQAGELGPYGRGSLSTLTGKVTGGGMAGNAALYDNLRQGFTALIARSTGERGVLTDADAARAMKLIPDANTTPAFAARQFEEIRKIFRDSATRIGGQGQWNPSIPQPNNFPL